MLRRPSYFTSMLLSSTDAASVRSNIYVAEERVYTM